MKMKKLFSRLLLLAMAMLLVAGCGGEKKAEVVKIGFLAPLTGGNAATGVGLKNSADLAVKKANESGKYPYKFEVVFADDAGDPSTAVSAANKLIADKNIVAVGGHFNSGCALATVPIFHRSKVPIVITAAIHPDITGKGFKEVTRVMTAANVQNEYAGELATKEWGVKTICLINDRTDYGKTNATQFGEAAKKNGATILSEDGIAVGQQDFSALLTNIKAKNPDAVYFGGVATEAALLKRQMADLKMDCLFLSDSGIISDTFNKIAGDAAAGMIAFNIGKPLEELPGGKQFKADYEAAKYAEPYEAYGQFAYDTMGVIMDAISRAKSTDHAKVIEAIRTTKNYKGVIGDTTFDENGQTTTKLITTFISDGGKWVSYDKATIKVVDKKIKK
jgi:branched-chain amino acid transport system substrate-binding protein